VIRVAGWSTVVLVAALGIGCAGKAVARDAPPGGSTGGSGGTMPEASLLCVPGQSVVCAGPGACPGGQVCSADGREYGPCVCSLTGAGGSAGAGGRSDAGGDASPGRDGTVDARADGDADAGRGAPVVLGPDGKLTIWTVGDSMTTNAGYRTRMCTTLTAEGYSVWFVGSVVGGGTPCNQGDNDGHAGFTIAGVLNGVGGSGTIGDWYAAIKRPQVATLIIGMNDIAWWVNADVVMTDVAEAAMGIVEKILGFDPTLVLIVGTIPPESSSIVQTINRDRADLVNEYNAALRLRVRAHAQYGTRLLLADTGAALTVADLYDGIHPNATGHQEIGDAWLSVLTPLLPAP
jgi:lysophospholipase L1-like esterase